MIASASLNNLKKVVKGSLLNFTFKGNINWFKAQFFI